MAKKGSTVNWGNFESIPDVLRHRLVIQSYGWDKTGKNHFGYTMPDPILGLYMDPGGAEGVAERFIREGKDIRAVNYRYNKATMSQEEAIEIRDRFIADYAHALTVARSIQWDETETWELFRFAEFGRESGLQRDYGPLNGMYRGLIQDAYDAGVNLQLIQKVKVKYKNDKATDEVNPQGFQMAGNIVQVRLEHFYDEEDEGDDRFKVRIVKARQNTSIWGEAFPNLTFSQLGVLVYPDTEEEDWQ